MTTTLSASLSCVVMIGLALPGKVLAAEGIAGLEEIVVTARKRAESLQDVPTSITAINGDALAQIAAQGYEDFVRMAPGLAMSATGFGNFSNFTVRGVATGTQAQILQSPTSLYIDDFPTRDPFAPYGTLNLHLADIDHVEVMRGPQGTLFGSGSLSGTVRVLTRRPEFGVFGGYADAAYEAMSGGERGASFEGMINIPLGERATIRAVAYDRFKPGYIDNVARNVENSNGGSITGGRLALRGQVTDRLTLTVTAIYQEDDADDGEQSFEDASLGGPRNWNSLTANTREGEAKLGNLLLEYDFGPLTLTSATSYLDTEYRVNHSKDSLSNLLAFYLSMPAAIGTPTSQAVRSPSQAFIEDLRVSSNGEGRLSYVAGLYYSDWDNKNLSSMHNPVVEPLLPLPIVDGDLRSNVVEKAAYGELNFDVTDTLELAAGVRYSRNRFQARSVISGLLRNTVADDDITQESTTPRFTATWRPSDNLSLYAQAARGYRIGQSNLGVPNAPPYFKPDKLWNYETGVKTTFWDGRARINAALYYIDWKDLQISLVSDDGLAIYTDNAGSARSQGLEVEASFLVTEGLELMSSFTFGDAELTEDVPDLVQPSGAVGVKRGDKLPGSTDFTIANALKYSRAFGNDRSFFVRLDHQYVGESKTSFSDFNAYRLGDYNVFGMSAGLEIGGGLSFSLYGRNLGEDDSIANVIYDGLGGLDAAMRVAPRTVGVAVRKDF